MPSNRGTNARGRIVNQSLGIISLCTALLACPAAVRAQSPAFTYQGQLKQSGVPFNGTVALGCTLWDAATNGNQVGTPINLPAVNVTNGLFTVVLNSADEFGASAFNGDPRWLAISFNGTPLSPRQALTAVPYAHHSARPWVTSGSDISYVAGNVGIGTVAPQARLHIGGAPGVDGLMFPDSTIQYTATLAGPAGADGAAGAAGPAGPEGPQGPPGAEGESLWSGTAGNNIYYAGANVGIGTTNPQALLHLGGQPGVDGLMFPDGSLQLTATLDGPAGPEGPQGPEGPVGPEGPQGPPGAGGGESLWGGTAGADIYYVGANVGIGTSTPATTLDVVGSLRADNASATNGAAGILGLASDAAAGNYGVMGQTNSGYGRAVFGLAPAAAGVSFGGWFESASASGTGVYGTATAGTGTTYGVVGGSFSTGGCGVYGAAAALTGSTYGVYGESASTAGRGVFGLTTATGGNTTYGVYGQSQSTNGAGVFGTSPAASGSTAGGIFQASSVNGVGVFGHATAPTGSADGGHFVTESISGFGVLGWASSTGSGGTKGGDFESDSSNGIGVSGYAFNANGQTYGVFGSANSSSGRGVFGYAGASSGFTYGVYGQVNSTLGRAVYGLSNTSSGGGDAVFGQASGTAGRGTVGYATNGSGTTYGVWGQADSTNGRGVFGYAPAGTGLTFGVLGQAGLNGWAVYALGDMGASGLKPFRIDHPLDPENKYLFHYATESPYPQNFYSGNAVTDANGYAWIELPEYFAAVNNNLKYQLTVVDDNDANGFVQAKVSRKIQGNRFQVRTSMPGAEVSWRVEADRNDLYVRAKKPKDVVEKQGLEKGTYQHPALYGQPPERGVNYDATRPRPDPEQTTAPALPQRERGAYRYPERHGQPLERGMNHSAERAALTPATPEANLAAERKP